jgi:hypothetical protein
MGKKIAVVFTVIWLILGNSWALTFDRQAAVDLDGDKEVDQISISTTESGDFLLDVDGIETSGHLTEGEADGFAIVDIDLSDKFKEIAVHTPGPSDDDEYLIYRYDGRSIKEMGRLSGGPKFSGNGIVLVDDWMGFWIKREKYVLDKGSMALRLVPQELYYVGIEGKVDKGFPIYEKRTGSDVVANVRPGSKVLIIACDPSPTSDDATGGYFLDWYLIKSETGLVGWARLGEFGERMSDLPWAD